MLPVVANSAEGIEPLVENGKRIYTSEQFARFAPKNAADVVAQIPGYSITQVSDDRGLGEASQNVLINGQRITGKGNDAGTALRRIPVNTIRRLEIMDAAMLDISGLSGQVLNVVTEQKEVQGNFVWRPRIRERVPEHWFPGELSVSGDTSLGAFSLGLRVDGFRGGGWGREVETRPGTGVSFIRYLPAPRLARDAPRLSGTFNRRTAGGSIWNLNGSVERADFRRKSTILFQVPSERATTESSRGEDIKWNTELGTDYELGVGGGRLKMVGYFSERQGSSYNERSLLVDGAAALSGSRFSRDSTAGERVLRSEYRWTALNGDWAFTGEAAYNFIDAVGKLEVRDVGGVLRPVPVPGASSRVEEKRAESILTYSRTLNEGLSLQLSAGYEYSQLGQDSIAGRARRFWRPKGSVSLAWNPASQWEMNVKLQRKVGQLDFFDFLASIDVNNNNANGSNAELVPPQSWMLHLETIRNLGAKGKVRFVVEAESVQDLVTQVPISAAAEAPGNLAKARRLQLTVDATLLLDFVGIPGGKLGSFFSWRDTRMRDPLFGTNRQWDGFRSNGRLDFRQDVVGSNWAWGIFSEWQSAIREYRLDYEEWSLDTRPFGMVFVENKNVSGLKMRLGVGNALNGKDRSISVNYVARRDGPVDYRRENKIIWHPVYQFTLSGTF